ncbi:MAG: hypothetical protein Q9227_009041 [Pyrenula ochraceoflavens]
MAGHGTVESDVSLLESILQWAPAPTTIADDSEPDLKRRKIAHDIPKDASGPREVSEDYVPLSKASIALVQRNDAATIVPYQVSTPVLIKSINEEGDTISFRMQSKTKKPSPQFSIRGLVVEGDAALLKRATGLRSIHAATRADPPIAAYNANLVYKGRNGDQDSFIIEVSLLWRKSEGVVDNLPPQASQLLGIYFPLPDANSSLLSSWSPRDFYDNVHVPEKTDALSADIRHPLMVCDLYPFQRRAVRWLLSREGVDLHEDSLKPFAQSLRKEQISQQFFAKAADALGQPCYVSHGLGMVTDEPSRLQPRSLDVKGGILAEEMGLGKTVEMIAVICLHQQSNSPVLPDAYDSDLRRIGSTLIITPPSILEQWKEELQMHAPMLKVFHYQGLKYTKSKEKQLLDTLASSDVVLTTYNVLSSEIHYADEKPQRDFRNKKRFEPRRSPLVRFQWWRVCLDEAQMVESGVSNAAKVARLIPRQNAWAVSGTPLRHDHKDLFGLLLFLHYEPWCLSLKIWNRLLAAHTSVFKSMIRNIAIRHNKDAVREDLQLPPQTRNVITVPFTPIEEQHYLERFREMCEACRLDENGAPMADDWDPDSSGTLEQMRIWLTRLRQTVLHPEVGGRNKRALGASGGPLRTVMDVLEVMIDQNEGTMRSEQRTVLLSQLRRGQMLENAKRPLDALRIWEDAYEKSTGIVSECREHLNVLMTKHVASQGSRSQQASENLDDQKDEPANLQAARVRLRMALEVQHIAIFFIGNACFQIKSTEELTKPESTDFQEWEKREESSYEGAKKIRSEMLTEILSKVNKNMGKIKGELVGKASSSIPSMHAPLSDGGIENHRLLDQLDELCTALNTQAEAFSSYKKKMIDFLSHSLVDEDEGVELQGDEYEASTKHQDEMYVYMEVLRAFFADRYEAITGQENLLINHEMKVALKQAREGAGPAPELFIKVLAERQRLKPDTKELESLRSIIVKLRGIMNNLEWREGLGNSRAKNELAILDRILQATTKMSKDQTKIVDAIEKELELFRETMNLRLEYYRQLQKISDTVAPFDEASVGQPLDQDAFDAILKAESKIEEKISKVQSKRRYLIHLQEESTSQKSRVCIICQSDFETGTLTVCGHQFCKDCIKLWWHDHHTCPVCKRRLHLSDFHDISYKPQELAVVEEKTPAPSSSNKQSSSPIPDAHMHQNSIYTTVSSATLNQIKNIDLPGTANFGTKVSLLCRHLIWLRHSDPGSKTLIFSQFREFLSILARAFSQQKISYSTVDSQNGLQEFKTKPEIECFLLHAKAHAAGVNLVVANHVVLCEPLINTAIELQAIARVHRIGQRRATKVWMYLVQDTVEEAIYDISVARRLEHVKRVEKKPASRSGTATPSTMQEKTLDEANSKELTDAILGKMVTGGKGGGEVVADKDLWGCLFGVKKTKKDVPLEKTLGKADEEGGRWLREDAAMRRMQAMQAQ